MKFTLVLAAAVASLLFVGCTTPSSDAEDPDTVVLRCFCQQLDTERKAEAQQSQGGVVAGVPTTRWPMVDPEVENCIQTTLGVDHDAADHAFLQVRQQGALKGQNDGVDVCSSAGYSVDETTPEPARPGVMQAARESNCRMLAEPPAPDGESVEQITADSKKKTEQQIATFAAQMGISQQAAETALNRAAAEMEAGTFDCHGGQAAAPSEQ
jgi:hypothetical protein